MLKQNIFVGNPTKKLSPAQAKYFINGSICNQYPVVSVCKRVTNEYIGIFSKEELVPQIFNYYSTVF